MPVNPCHKTVHCAVKVESTHPIQLSTAGAYRQKTDATPTLNTNILSPHTPGILGIISLTRLEHPFVCFASLFLIIESFVEIKKILVIIFKFITLFCHKYLKVRYSMPIVINDLKEISLNVIKNSVRKIPVETN